MIKSIFVLFFIYLTTTTNSFAIGKAMINQAKEIAKKNNLNFVNNKEETDDEINKNNEMKVIDTENRENIINTNNEIKKDKSISEETADFDDNEELDISDEYNFLKMVIQELNKIDPNEDEETAGKKLVENLRRRFREEFFNVSNKEELEKKIKDLQNEMENLSKINTNSKEFSQEELEKVKRIFEREMKAENFTPPYSANYYKDFRSFMFPSKNINLIRRVLEIYDKNNSSANNDIFGNDDDEENNYDASVGNVYLKSIMYISKKHWAVWINSKKISNENNNDEDNEFFIKKINRNTVEIKWRVSKAKWGIINYENTISKSNYTINEQTHKVEFDLILHPNQTFVASKNEVIDGKYKPAIKIEDINKITDEHLDSIFNGEDIDLDLLIK